MEERVIYLFEKHLNRQATIAERGELFSLLKSDIHDPQVLSLIDRYYEEFTPQNNPFSAEVEGETLHAIFNAEATPKIRPLWPRMVTAASIIIALSIGGYLLVNSKLQQQLESTFAHDITPGQNKATLTLANGQKILLYKGLSGKLAQQGNMQIGVNNGNAIAYTPSGQENHSPAQPAYNSLSTAKGEQSPYPLVLADGSKIWLNAASSITFPTTFSGKERMVKLTGEAYFEVAPDAQQKFKVESAGQVTEDIGTHFNIMAYADEPATKVTLTEGAVKVNGQFLKPGEQTVNTNGNIKVTVANMDVELAWKQGYFRFSDASITTVMRELSRWYNIQVVYDGKQTSERFNAKISRYKNISAVLHILEKTKGVNFKIEGRRIIVLNKS